MGVSLLKNSCLRTTYLGIVYMHSLIKKHFKVARDAVW